MQLIDPYLTTSKQLITLACIVIDYEIASREEEEEIEEVEEIEIEEEIEISMRNKRTRASN